MLNFLNELKERADTIEPPPVAPGGEKVLDEDIVVAEDGEPTEVVHEEEIHVVPEEIEEVKDEDGNVIGIVDVSWLDFIEEQKEIYKVILEDEGITIQACQEVRQRVENMQEIVSLEKEALLPTKLSQLANRFDSQEMVCQRMINRAKGALATLRLNEENQEDYDEDDPPFAALQPVRNAMAKARSKQFKALVSLFFAARSSSKQETMSRAARQLRFAYPDALDEELSAVLESPDLAFAAISKRLENGPEVTLEGIVNGSEMEGMEVQRLEANKLEQGAKELKLMFLQFSELIDTQGENINSIEANIKTVMEDTTEAIGILVDAEAEKRSYEGKMGKLYCFMIILVLCFCYKLYAWVKPAIVDTYDSVMDNYQWTADGLHGSAALVSDVAGAVSSQADPAPAEDETPEEKEEEPASALQMFEAHGSKSRPHKSRDFKGPRQVAAEVSQRRNLLPGGSIPRHKPLLDNPVIRSVAVLATGGASRHRSAFLKPKAGTQQENNTASL